LRLRASNAAATPGWLFPILKLAAGRAQIKRKLPVFGEFPFFVFIYIEGGILALGPFRLSFPFSAVALLPWY
jgi:hypothetical protein